MKQGKGSLVELAHALENEQNLKQDFVADTRKTTFSINERGPMLDVDNIGSFDVTTHAARQVCSRLKVPAKMYDLLADGTAREKAALAEVVNARLHEHPERRMVRAFASQKPAQGQVRAYLSAKYRRMDSLDLLVNILPALTERGDMRVASCEVTERRMFLKVIFDEMQAEPVVGDVVRAGLCISNSEVGHGSLRVEPMIERLVCLNGMIVGTSLKKFHVGRAQDEGLLDVLTDEALEADDEALWLKVRDVVRASLDRTRFDEAVAKLSDATARKVDDVPAAVEMLAQRFRLSDSEREGVLSALITGDVMLDRHGLRATQYGLVQAVTAYSQRPEVEYERATTLEQVGGQIIELKPAEWRSIARAA